MSLSACKALAQTTSYLIDIHVFRNGGPGGGSKPRHYVHHTRWEAGLPDQLSHGEPGEGGLLRQLHHHRVPCGQGRPQFPRLPVTVQTRPCAS